MYGFYEMTGPRKHRFLAGLSFDSIENAIAYLGAKVAFAEIDAEADAADVFTTLGQVIAVEAI